MSTDPAAEATLRELAVSRLKKQADFRLHVLIYLLMNGFLVVIWWMTGSTFFWPVFLIFGWGIGLAANACAGRGRPGDPHRCGVPDRRPRLQMQEAR